MVNDGGTLRVNVAWCPPPLWMGDIATFAMLCVVVVGQCVCTQTALLKPLHTARQCRSS